MVRKITSNRKTRIKKHTQFKKSLRKHTNKKDSNILKPQNGGDPNTDIMPYLKSYGILDPQGKYPNPLTGYDYSENYLKFSIGNGLEEGKKPWSEMPVYKEKERFFNMLHKNNVMLFISKTGSGKTVLAPKLMLHYFDYNCQIAITLPKQNIAESAAKFAAVTLDVNLGEHVGYVHGADKSHYSPKYTNLIYMTEGILLSQMTGSEPDISRYSGVIIDEAHERSTNVDILMMLLKKLVIRRPEFKLIVMSATVSEKIFKDYFDVPGIKFDVFEPQFNETLFKIEDQFTSNHVPKQNSDTEFIKKLKEVVAKTKGSHVISFVSTKAEANKACKEIAQELEGSDMKPVCIPYYSGIKDTEKKYFDAADKNQLYDMGHGRLIVVATNAVESSVTLNGTEYVIDTGLEYRVKFDPVKIANVRGKEYSTQAQIKQRCGRTGRTNSGYCIRIYSKAQYNRFEEFPEPSIKTENFTARLLDIVGMKLTGNLTNALAVVQELISPPDNTYLKHAINCLYYNNLMYKDGYLTEIGKAVRKLANKISPELALMVLASTSFQCTYEVIVIASMMSMGGLDEWVSEPDDKSRNRTKADYMSDLRRWSKEFYNYGDHFVYLAIYMEYYKSGTSPQNKKKWCNQHGVNFGLMTQLETTYKNGRPVKFGLIDDIYRKLEGLTYLPKMFDEPDKEPLTRLKTGYRSLTEINEDKYNSGKYSSGKYSSGRYSSKYGGGKSTIQQGGDFAKVGGSTRMLMKGMPYSQSGGRAKKNKQPKVDKQAVARENAEEKAKRIFKEYYMPVDGILPRKPNVEYLEDEILCCIYYAFHRNVGVYLGGGGKKYKTKISPVSGSMKGSVFDIIPELEFPELCIYHTLDVSITDYGESSGYQTVSAIDEDLMEEFL